MQGRLVAGGVGRGGVAGNGQRLTTASPPIDFPSLATAAELRHPVGASEGVEGGTVVPDVRQPVVLNIPELQPRKGCRCVTRQYLTRRRYIHGLTAPGGHARLGR